MKTWDEKGGFLQGMVTNRPMVKIKKVNKSNIVIKSESRDIRLQTLSGKIIKSIKIFFFKYIKQKRRQF